VGQFIYALIAFAPILIIMRRRRESLASAGVSAANLGRSLVVGAFLVSVFVGWCFLVSRRCDAGNLSRISSLWALLQFAIVGFAEEFAYRGYLQTRLIGWLGNYRGWILASVLMAMAHIAHRVAALHMTGGEALLSSASLIPISLFLGYIMLRTQSIVAPGLLHTVINWLEL
jgi:membrane protease YdiL (CAAX protease family)